MRSILSSLLMKPSSTSGAKPLSIIMIFMTAVWVTGCEENSANSMTEAGEIPAGDPAGHQAGETAGEQAGEQPGRVDAGLAGEDSGEIDHGQAGSPTSPLPPQRDPLVGPALEGAMILDETPPQTLRVGWVDQEEEALHGPDLSCRIGSVRMENSQIRICIQGMSSLTQFKRRGGNLVDALRWDTPLRDGISEVIVAPGFGEVDPESIEILADGQDAPPAIVQVRGVVAGSRILTSYLPSYVPRPTPVISEYHLYPDREEVELHSWIEVGSTPISLQVSDFVVWTDPAKIYYPQREGNRIPVDPEYLGAHLPNLSYLWRIDGLEKLRVLTLPDIPFQPISVGQVQAPAGVQLYVKRVLHIGRGGVTPLAEKQGFMPPQPQKVQFILSAQTATGDTLTSDNIEGMHSLLNPVSLLDQVNLEIYTLTEDGERSLLIAQTRTSNDEQDVSGSDDEPRANSTMATLHLSPGSYQIRAPQWSGGALNRQLEVPEPEDSEGDEPSKLDIDLVFPAPGELTLRERLLDQTGMDLLGQRGSKWVFTPQGEGITERNRVIHFVLGQRSILLPPGAWKLHVTRGWHFNAREVNVDVESGSSQTLEVMLIEELPLTGWSSGEFHQHSSPSLDSEVSLDTRILSNIAEGVGFMVPSDHDVLVDYPTIVRQRGYSSDIGAPMTGIEISPRVGHLGAYGIHYDSNHPEGAGGAPPLSIKIAEGEEGRPDVWRLRTIPELIRKARESGAEVIQLNHPRDSTGYFDTVNFDPELGEAPVDHDQWSDDFDTIEVFNEAGDFCVVMRDWQALLLQGGRIVAVGNSDSHGLGRPVGYPRNYLPTNASLPQEITRDEIVEALTTGRVSVGGGSIIELTNDLMWGETLTGPQVNIPLRIRTPSFARINRLIALFNGQEIWSRTLEEPLESLIDFDEEITLDLREDGPLIFFAEGPRLGFVHPGQPTFALTNPLWIDGDGDGQITMTRDYTTPTPILTSFCP